MVKFIDLFCGIGEDNEANIINVCKKIRKLAQLDRISLDISEHRDARNTHLFKYLDYCGVDKKTFVKNYLSNLQPYMLSRNTEQEKSDNTICVLDNIYRISLYIKLDTTFGNEMIVSFHEDHKRGVARDNSRLHIKQPEKVKIIADSLTGGITDTNTKTFNVLIPRGVISVPVSLVGELQDDGTIEVQRSAIDNAILDICNQYIQDLYASDMDFPSLNEVELFSALQQIPFTSYGNSVFSNISVLIDNMAVQDNPLYKKTASFALETYASHLILTSQQKKELIELIHDKYEVSCQKNISVVTNMLIDIIKNLNNEPFIIQEKDGDKKIKDKHDKDDRNDNTKGGAASNIPPDKREAINSLSDFVRKLKENISEMIADRKERVIYSLEHIIKRTREHSGLSR